ncbi:FG-GAP repeat protein [Streptomyces sp. NPDC005388]|uniref:FG-GAP repeat protein n=1 Tax=Streptomyces sp. NPDC005388 TaxID=3156717 RepID=UPI0033A6F217
MVGAPGEDIGSARDVGLQTVVWGGAGGLATATTVGQGRAETRAGDFDGDGHLDLATAYQMRYGPFSRSGAAARTGPLVDLDVRVYAMEGGDVDGDGTTDQVVSSGPWDSDDGGRVPPPRLRLLKGTGNGLVAGPLIAFVGVVRGMANGFAARATLIGQNTRGVPGAGESGDRFGTDVSVGDITGDGCADVVTGVPGEDLAGRTDAGTFAVLRGGSTGLSGTRVQVFSQNTAGVPGTAENGDRFGSRTAVVGGHVAVWAPEENSGSGAVWIFRGATSGVTATRSVSFGPRTLAAPVSGARFGAAFHRRGQ